MADPSDGASPRTEAGSWNRGKYFVFLLCVFLHMEIHKLNVYYFNV